MPAITPEQWLISTIWGIYLLGCLHWVGPGEVAYVGDRSGKWISNSVLHTSYTLLGRMPVLRNPMSTYAGFAIVKGRSLDSTPVMVSEALTRGVRNRTRILAIVSAALGIYMLIVLPAFIVMGLLPRVWLQLLLGMAALQSSVLLEFWVCTRFWRRSERASYVQVLLSISLNPLGAVRSADLISNWMIGRSIEKDQPK
jgi:hypothetical protein